MKTNYARASDFNRREEVLTHTPLNSVLQSIPEDGKLFCTRCGSPRIVHKKGLARRNPSLILWQPCSCIRVRLARGSLCVVAQYSTRITFRLKENLGLHKEVISVAEGDTERTRLVDSVY